MELVEDSKKQDNLYDEIEKDDIESQYQYEKGKVFFIKIFKKFF
jgi:hypothetical protein